MPRDKVQFRTGPDLSVRLQDRAEVWCLTINETSKRLTTLSEFELGIADYSEVAELAAAIGGNGQNFARAAAFIAFNQGQSPDA